MIRGRYSFIKQKISEAPDGTTIRTLCIRDTQIDQTGGGQYEVQAGEDIFLLADRFCGTESLWWVLADANPQIFNPLDLQPGDTIIIPTSEYLTTRAYE